MDRRHISITRIGRRGWSNRNRILYDEVDSLAKVQQHQADVRRTRPHELRCLAGAVLPLARQNRHRLAPFPRQLPTLIFSLHLFQSLGRLPGSL